MPAESNRLRSGTATLSGVKTLVALPDPAEPIGQVATCRPRKMHGGRKGPDRKHVP